MTQWVIFFKHLNFRLGILASVSLFGDDINSSGENELVTCSRATRHQKGHTQAITRTSIPTDNLVQHKRKAELVGSQFWRNPNCNPLSKYAAAQTGHPGSWLVGHWDLILILIFWFLVFDLWFLTRWAGTQLRRQVTLALGWWVGGSVRNLGFDESSWL